MSVTAEIDPKEVANVTLAPPVVMSTPPLVLVCTVITVVVTPFATIELDAAVIVEVAGSALELIKSTVSLSVMATAFKVPVIVAVPGAAAEVKVAV